MLCNPLKNKRKANDPLAGDAKGRAEKWVAKLQGWLRPPFCAPEAGRSTSFSIQEKIKYEQDIYQISANS